MSVRYYYPNRTLCDVLDEMRKCTETQNYSYIKGLIEEAQMLGNRMEAKLEDGRDLDDAHEELREAKAKLKELNKQIKDKEWQSMT